MPKSPCEITFRRRTFPATEELHFHLAGAPPYRALCDARPLDCEDPTLAELRYVPICRMCWHLAGHLRREAMRHG